MNTRLELIVSSDIHKDHLDVLEKIIKNVIKDVYILPDVLIVHVVDSHDVVRSILGIEKNVEYDEKPIKLFIDYDTLEPVLSIRKDFVNMSIDELRLEIARELTTYEVIMDPIHVERWAIPENIDKISPLDAMLSTAIILRLVDSLLVSRRYKEIIAQEFHNNAKDIVNIAEDIKTNPKVRALEALCWDIPISFELAGYRDIGSRLFLETRKFTNIMSEYGRSFLDKYDDFRSFSRNNFYFENIREYLDLVFED